MSKKILLIIAILVILISLFGVFLYRNKKTKIKEEKTEKITNLDDIPYDEETGLYYIRDEETGEIIGASKVKEEMKFYIDNPDYNPNPLKPRPTDLKSFLSEGAFE